MRDKHGNEIHVGDTVKFSYCDKTCKYGTVSDVNETEYCVLNWNSPGWYECSGYVEVILTEQQESSTKSLSELKRQAQQEILEIIQKHTAAINSAGGNFGVNVSMYDAKELASNTPRQLVDVNVTVTI